ncbi:MAG: ATP-grasp domain-containing protein [Bacteroidetes bacterium]|nr:ATP-grasp domain-containing protein [Bacteroidota bacterium]MBU1680327.1 ATP-grasp domain-containing protein [Bacteroidota bacterium]MBU2505737.1 ATP-grasp domain-containing protein [Bacteroidota bacterium]
MIYDKKILICYNEPASPYENYLGKSVGKDEKKIDLSESEFMNTLITIEDELKRKFNDVASLGFNGNFVQSIDALRKIKPDIIFNFVESIEGHSNFESYVTGVFDMLEFEYTGNNTLCLGNCLNKIRTKHILRAEGVPTPDYLEILFGAQLKNLTVNLEFPLIAKLATEDASIGISEFSVVSNHDELIKHVEFLFSNYSQNVILEEYISGRELNVAILGDEILEISEISFKGLPAGLPSIVTYEAKWAAGSVYYNFSNPVCPAPLKRNIRNKIEDIAIKSFNALGCRDYGRVDIRLTDDGNPFVIEVNPNPDISLDSGFVRAASAAGLSYLELLERLAHFVYRRINNDQKN